MNVAVPLTSSTSSAADTVTVCAEEWFVAVNVSELGLTVRSSSPPLARAIATVTLAPGCVPSATVYVADPSSGTDRVAGVSTIPVSLSVSAAARVAAATLP